MGVYFCSLAVDTTCDKILQECEHPWPPIVLLHLVKCAEEPFMPPSRELVEGRNEVRAGWFRDVKPMFEV